MEIRESQVEDVLATYPHITQRLLALDNQLSLLARQTILPSGRLDLLFASGNKLLLLELKVEECCEEHIQQIISYRDDLQALQAKHMLVQGDIVAFLVCTAFPDHVASSCKNNSITAVQYSPAEVLEAFFFQVQKASPFMVIQPMDSGLWNIHLINRAVYALVDGDRSSLLDKTGLSQRSIGNHLRFAEQLCLVKINADGVNLTNLGQQYVFAQDARLPLDSVSEDQARLLRDFIVKDPFVTPTVFGIYLMIESVFALSRNTYPVPTEMMMPYFRDSCGKRFLWQTQKSIYHGTRMYSNYGVELGILGKVGNKLLLTPSGVRFILLLQLHKGIRMVDAL